MDAQESALRFKEADALFREGQYQESLVVLEQLHRLYPREKNILYPAALCLEKLGRTQEALRLSDMLITQYQDPRAQALKARLNAAAADAPFVPDIRLDFDLDSPRPRPAPRVVYQDNSVYWWIGGMVVAAIVIIVAAAFLRGHAAWLVATLPKPSGGGLGALRLPAQAIPFLLGSELLTGLLAGFPAGYLALRVAGYLQNDFVEDVKEVIRTVLLCNVMLLTCIGMFFVPFYLKKRYEMGFGELVLTIIMYNVISAALSFVFSEMAGGLGSALVHAA